jgi:hypothetical protein
VLTEEKVDAIRVGPKNFANFLPLFLGHGLVSDDALSETLIENEGEPRAGPR